MLIVIDLLVVLGSQDGPGLHVTSIDHFSHVYTISQA